MYCRSCGEQIKDGSKFCAKCGNTVIAKVPSGNIGNGNIEQDRAERKSETVQGVVPAAAAVSKGSGLVILGIILTSLLGFASIYLFVTMKTRFPGWIIAAAVLIISGILQKFLAVKGFKTSLIIFAVTIVAVSGTFAFTTDLKNSKNGSTINGTEENTDPQNSTASNSTEVTGSIVYDISSVVSLGVSTDDLGNIINGQYFFDDGINQYYSSFDSDSVPHIYVQNGSSASAPIFDGFGWSLVVYGDWLYFSGNEGTSIDGTYNLFRIRTDGSEKQLLNNGFCYNMSFYNEWLYYIKKSDYSSTSYSLCRSNIDGSNEQVVVSDGGNCGIVFEEKIYFIDSSNNICSADPDGSNRKVLINEAIKYFIIGSGKLIYLDGSSNIMTADIDGSDIKTVLQAGGQVPYTINSYKDKIYYTYCDTQAVTGRNAYQYYLHSIGFNGSDDNEIYTGVSYGCYINILDDKVYVLDYAADLSSGIMIAVAKNMGLNGGNANDLPR